MTIGGFFMRVHEAIAKKVLGEELVQKAKRVHEESEERKANLEKKVVDLEMKTHEICRGAGLVTNGQDVAAEA